jgi:hypothetical protein
MGSTATRRRRARRAATRRLPGPFLAADRQLRRHGSASRRCRRDPFGRRRAGPGRFLAADRHAGARLLLPLRRAAGHAHEPRRPERRRRRQRMAGRRPRADHQGVWRGASRPPRRAPRRPGPRRGTDRNDRAAGGDRAGLRAEGQGQDRPRHPYLPGPSRARERRTGRIGPRVGGRRTPAFARRPAGRRRLPQPGGSPDQGVSEGALGPRGPRLPPSAARPGPQAPSFDLRRAGSETPSAAEAAGNPRARSARLRVATRTEAAAWREIIRNSGKERTR